MPYIPKELRAKIDNEIELLIAHIANEAATHSCARMCQSCGLRAATRAKMITYAFFKVVKVLYGHNKAGWYERGDVAKICRSVEREFERRFMDPYEQEKMEENSDV
jgi:hypothetical protein